MAGERFTLDTNILFYAIDTNAGDKHNQANHLLRAAAPKTPFSCFKRWESL